MAAPAAPPRGEAAAAVGQPPSAPRRARTAREGKGQLQMKKGRTSVSCPFMESICSWRPAMVAKRLAWSDMMAGCVCGVGALKGERSRMVAVNTAFFFECARESRLSSTLGLWGVLGSGVAGAAPDVLLEGSSKNPRHVGALKT